MINASLMYIRDVLNEFIKTEYVTTEDMVVLSNIVNLDGSSPEDVDDKIVFFLVNLQEEATMKNTLNRSVGNGNNEFHKKNPNIHLNLQLAFCANFEGRKYSEGLQYLSTVIKFFQINNILNPVSTEDLPSPNRLIIELCKLDFNQMSHLWSAIGGKLMPSAYYKVRLLVLDDVPPSKIIPVVSSTKEPK